MSGGDACKCTERKKPIGERMWECWHYKCNFSAFNGYCSTRTVSSAAYSSACTSTTWCIPPISSYYAAFNDNAPCGTASSATDTRSVFAAKGI